MVRPSVRMISMRLATTLATTRRRAHRWFWLPFRCHWCEGDRGIPYPVVKAAIPAWVKKYGNGTIPQDKMIKVAPIGSGYLVPEAAAAWRNLQNAAAVRASRSR